ncbi:MAG: TPM domain-containing protein [Candidatus Komeilibacteria bacterium]|nr:TPM domain-containing protein [Candidatus Komeilibacteria bacterium]
MLWRKIAITSLFLISVAGISNAYYELPKPTGFITDTANLLSANTKAQLESKEDRKVRIEVGYGLEQYLTDAQSYWIIQNQITPNFQANNYDQGIISAVDSIKKAVSGAEVIPQAQPTTRKNFKELEFFFYLGFIIFIWLGSIMARSKSWWLGGVVGGVVGLILLIFFVKLVTGIILTIILSAIGLAFDYGVSKNYDKSKKHGTIIPWWWGGGFGGGGFGGGSSGGFGGFGGGGSGGGGSSGGW